MAQVTEKELTEDTQRYVSILEEHLGETMPLGEIKNLFEWKGFYRIEGRYGKGAIVTLRNVLRLVSSRHDGPVDERPILSIPIFTDYLIEILRSTDGYFGRGVNTVRCDLQLESTQELCSKIRESEPLNPFSPENMGWIKVYPYLNHPSLGALVIEVRHERKGFGLFLFRGESRRIVYIEELKKALS